ncbi:MAG TPA: PIN domain-containing protein [Candidatus Limnocylindria bacterium]|nr:PIN domain-containing protein [Candidatus Limnocylindria bacterium]
MKTCFDANILLEVLLRGRRKAEVAAAALVRAEQACISPLSAHLYVYFGQKEKHTLADLLEDIQSYKITDMGSPVLRWAITNRQDDDFEDALQVACAVLGDCKQFVTFDGKLAKNYGSLIDVTLLS